MRPLSRRLVLALVLGSCVSTAQSAHASSCTARPGSAAVDQYCEAIPSASGKQLSKQDADAMPAKPAAVARSTARTLKSAGTDGAAILQLSGGAKASTPTGGSRRRSQAKATAKAPSTPGGSASRPEGAPGSRSQVVAGDRSGNVLKAVESAATSGPAAGGALVWILLLTSLAVVGVGWGSSRRRRE